MWFGRSFSEVEPRVDAICIVFENDFRSAKEKKTCWKYGYGEKDVMVRPHRG